MEYLKDKTKGSYDIPLEVSIVPAGGKGENIVCKSNLKYLYWNFRQQLAHHTINGCNMRPGDLCGTGTISGPVLMLLLNWFICVDSRVIWIDAGVELEWPVLD